MVSGLDGRAEGGKERGGDRRARGEREVKDR